MSVEVVNFSDHFSLTGMNGTFDQPENAIISRPYSPPSANRLFLCRGEPCDSNVALDGLALSSPTSSSAPHYTAKTPPLPAWSIALIIVAVGWLLGFVGFIIYRRRHPFRDEPEGSSRPAKWWNKLPLPKFGASELPAGQGKYNSAELVGSATNPIYELPAETVQRDIQYHGIPWKDTSEVGVLATRNSIDKQPESPARTECADTDVTFEVSISRENGDTTLTLKSTSSQVPTNRPQSSQMSPRFISSHESTPMLSPNFGTASPILASTPTSPTNDITAFTLPEISVSPPMIPLSPLSSPTIEVAEPPATQKSADMSRDQVPRVATPSSTFEVNSRPKPTIPPRPIRRGRIETAAEEMKPVLPAPLNEIELSPLTQISQSPPTPSRPVPPIPLPIIQTPSPTTPPSDRESSPPPKPSRPPSLPPRPVPPLPSQIAGNQTSAPSMGEQELVALAGAFAPPPLPPRPKSSPGNWVYK